jgi:hypothetical protein
MPIHVSCPNCRKTLNVPDHLLGKRVKCPECATPFDAQPDAPAQAAGFPAMPLQAGPAPEPNFPPLPLGSPDPLVPPRYDLPGDRDDTYSSRAMVSSRVQGPAIGLMVVAILGILFAILGLMLNLGNAANNRPNAELIVVISLGVAALGVVLNSFIIYGANEMRTLGSKGMAMTACILGIVNLPNCCLLLCLPFSIWGLVVLSDPDVTQAFRSSRPRRY